MHRRQFIGVCAAFAGMALAGAALAQTAEAKAKVDAAKAAGTVGEQANGLLGLVTGSADAATTQAVAEINNGRTAFLSAPVLQGTLEGGVPVIHDGQVIGAVGVSGVQAAQDAQVAKAGVAAL